MTSRPNPLHIAITGASGGLGRALSEHYARPGRRLSLAGRDHRRLMDCVQACRSRGALVVADRFDIRETSALGAWLGEADRAQPLDLVFANAGVSASAAESGLEQPRDLERLLEVNALGAARTALAAAELMTERGRGQIAIMGSLASLYPLKSCPAYCAGKAAARLYGLSLRAGLAPFGVGVTVVSPGYVDTPMSRRLKGSKPLLWDAERAAAFIAGRLKANPPEIVFPKILALGLAFLSCLPEPAAGFFSRGFSGFMVEPDEESSSRL